MNRIILIGNGFDLAHDMKTRYCDFLDNIWEKIICNINNSYINRPINNDFIKIKSNHYTNRIRNHSHLKEICNDFGVQIKYKSNFFKKLCNNNSYYWSNIEEEYYKSLIDIFKKEDDFSRNKYTIHQLNKEFKEIENLLETYLQEEFEKFIETNNYKDAILYKIFSEIKKI